MSKKDVIQVLDGRVALRQIEGGFRTSMDSVMLAAACPAKDGQHILDLGCGVGSIGLCILQRISDARLMGIDIQADHVETAWKNAALNGMDERAEFECADILTLAMESFDHVVCNPPYFEAGAHLHSPSPARAKAIGYVDRAVGIEDWVTCAYNHIKGQGSLSLIHEAGQVDNIIHALYGAQGGRRFGAVEIFPLYPHAGEPAKRVIIRAWKHKKSPATIHSGIIMHEQDGRYTAAADAVLRGADRLF